MRQMIDESVDELFIKVYSQRDFQNPGEHRVENNSCELPEFFENKRSNSLKSDNELEPGVNDGSGISPMVQPEDVESKSGFDINPNSVLNMVQQDVILHNGNFLLFDSDSQMKSITVTPTIKLCEVPSNFTEYPENSRFRRNVSGILEDHARSQFSHDSDIEEQTEKLA